jgi:hypothetical protein
MLKNNLDHQKTNIKFVQNSFSLQSTRQDQRRKDGRQSKWRFKHHDHKDFCGHVGTRVAGGGAQTVKHLLASARPKFKPHYCAPPQIDSENKR